VTAASPADETSAPEQWCKVHWSEASDSHVGDISILSHSEIERDHSYSSPSARRLFLLAAGLVVERIAPIGYAGLGGSVASVEPVVKATGEGLTRTLPEVVVSPPLLDAVLSG
jgi:hypothetical protein